MLPIRKFEPGEKLKVSRIIGLTNEKQKEQIEEVEVIKQYPHFVLVQNRDGTRYSVPNAKLYTMAMSKHGGKRRLKILWNDKGEQIHV